uniref:Vacuolar protein sorting-associated protein 33B n=1 Tax=Graphocephala atropunctata TaxID=36148 RepID=A0A1B6LIA7_9HEMI
MFCSLETRASALNRISQKRLGEMLNKIPGLKDFIIDPVLIKPLERIIGVSQLRFHGIDKIFKLDYGSTIPTTNSQVVYFVQSDLVTAKHICDQINAQLRNTNNPSFHIILIPQKLISISNLLEEEGVLGHVTLYGFQWEMIQFDGNILSLQLDSFYRKTFLDQDQLFLPCVARSIWGLQMLYGKPSMTFLQGKHAAVVDQQMDVLFESYGEPEKDLSDISCFVVVDRDIDYPSVLLTPGTYTSLLHEVFGIKSGVLDFSLESQNKTRGGRLLSSGEEIYSQIKHKHFSDVFGFLSKVAKNLQELKPTANMNVADLKRNTQELPNALALKSSLAYHISACEGIIGKMGPRFERTQAAEQRMLEGWGRKENISYLEDCIAMKLGGKLSPLRLLCLQSVTQDGLTADEIHSLKVQYLHAYGYKHLTSFHNLDKLGLLTQHSSGDATAGVLSNATAGALANKVAHAVSLPTRRSAFYSLAHKLKLFPTAKDDYDLKNPKDMSYVFNGAYIPLVCQIVHMLIKREVVPEEVAKLVPNAKVKMDKPSDIGPRTFLVYFIGGVTYSEIAAFYLLEKLTGAQILVAGTSIMNGNFLIESCL